MNNKGFTLVELIAVVSILAIIIIIAIPTYQDAALLVKDKNLENKKNIITSDVLNYAKKYELDEIKKEGNITKKQYKCYSMQYIIDKDIYPSDGYDKNGKDIIINPKTNGTLTGFVKVTYDLDKYKLTANFVDNCS